MIVLSLFDGGSVGRLALNKISAKVDKYYASEIEKDAIENTQRNFPDTIQLGDVSNWKEWDIEVPDLIIGGSPCQPFSRQGIGLNFNDPRSKLFFVYNDIVKHYHSINPNLKFMLENVDMKKEWENVITKHLGVEPMKINSELFLPQNRPRTYWTNFEIPKISPIQYSLLDYLDDIELDDYEIVNGIKVSNDFTDKHKALIIRTEENELAIKQATKRGFIEFSTGDGINLSFPTSKTRRGRVTRNKVGCLDTGCNVSVFDSKKQLRYLSINELERLQGLPVGYTKGMSETKAKKLIGNGWTTDVIAHILGGLK